MAQAVVPGQNTAATQHLLTFEVLEKRSLGRSEENNRERYWIKVKFDDGKVAVFRTESKSLKTAFEMIEMVGQQTKNLNPVQFNEHLNTMQGKRIWVNMTNVSTTPGFKIDQVTAYRTNSHGNALEYVYQASKGFNPVATINSAVVSDLKRYAKEHQAELDASAASLSNREIQVVMSRRH